ncbi:family 78 glycoside hydrolase catalytic domain [Rathayibacter sp. VKM Ac-2759]|uniref:alpha-L-rhamnosidase n=1 Tax=Rathayibacter sp. VKM Ac-2759 TaxID=2609252 RepID=UPI001315BC6B|nr:alpha-L-rhamnosidase [Rathayibacter sp. VKM Ac-2759]QHC65670.1 family 78 glycoside hydrolase catalytic domain [Rathayibacter sp. VKM Ac-2759]
MRTAFITPRAATGGTGDPASYLRREFAVTERPVRATLRSTAVGLIEPHLNGGVVGDEVLAPGWTSYRHRLVVSSHDVTDRIVIGSNAVGAVLGEGWALGRLGWEEKRHHYSDRPAAWLELVLEYGDGSTEVIGSDTSFRAATGGVRANSIYDGEDFDARLEPSGWDRAGFDDVEWGGVEPFDWPVESLVDPLAPPIRRIEELAPVEILTTPAGRTVVDFGQNVSGWVRLTASGPAGTTITLRHSEAMIHGEADFETIRTAAATDRYMLRGEGAETWEPRFTFHGFRYVEVDGWPGELDASALRAIVVHSDMTRTGWLETSNPLLNQLHSNAVWSMRDNFVGVPTDCPQRDERLGWTGDINAFAPTAAFLYDVRGVLGSWLRDLAVEQEEKGFVPWVVPDVLSTPSSPTALWSDVAVSLPWALYREYGDERILADAYGSMTAFIRQVAGLLDENGLWSTGFQYGDWLDPDAPIDNPAGGKTDRHLVAAAYLCRTTREMTDTARILGRADDAAEFGALADRVRRAFLDEYVSPNGRLVGETATAYALAITFDLLDEAQKMRAGDRLADIVARAGYRISTGFAGTPLVTDALSATGHLGEAYLLLLETGCPSFLYPVTMGATTIWERWDSIRPDGTINPSGMTSLNHYALGAVVDWMHRTIGGLTAVEPGYRRMRIAPLPGGGLTSAQLRHTTVHGEVGIAWSLDGGTATLDVSIPEGTSAQVVLPGVLDTAPLEVSAGEHHWSYEIEVAAASSSFDLDSTLGAVAADPAAWRRFTDVFARYYPGVPLDGRAPEAAVMPIRTLLDYIPGVSDEFRSDLGHALTPASTGASA